MSNFLEKGIKIMKEAVAADQSEEHAKAFSLYKQALNYLHTALKYEKNEKSKQMIRAKVSEYLQRAEELKNFLDKQSGKGPKKKAVTEGGGGDGDKKEDMDPDTAKLQGALSGAIVLEKPNVKWNDVAGLDQAKALLKEAVILPVKFPQLFTGERKPWKGILLYGPPGTGKSYLAKAVATEAGASTFLSVSSSDLVSKYQGESERLVKNLFELARKNAPAIIFIDEVDSLCSARGEGENESARRIKTEFLVQMQGVGKDSDNILVLGATNTPWELDPAIRRRFEKRVYIPLPELAARTAMFKIHIGKTPHSLSEKDFQKLSKHTDGFSGSDIAVMVRDALYEPIRTCQSATHFKKVFASNNPDDFMFVPCSPYDKGAETMDLMELDSKRLKPLDVTMNDFLRVLTSSKASVGQQDLKRHEDWTKEFGQEG